MLEANQILEEISKPVGLTNKNPSVTVEDDDNNSSGKYVSSEDGDNQNVIEKTVVTNSINRMHLANDNDIMDKSVPKLDLSNVEPDIDTTSDEEDEEEDENDEEALIIAGKHQYDNHNSETNSKNYSTNTTDCNTAFSLQPQEQIEVQKEHVSYEQPKPMENATLSFLSEYSKRALQQAEKALFSPQDFNDVVQHSTSEEEDDDEGLI